MRRYHSQLQRRFHAALLQQDLSVEQIADPLGLAAGSLRNIINGGPASDHTRQRLTNVLGVVLWDKVKPEILLQSPPIEFELPSVEEAANFASQFPQGSMLRDASRITVAPGIALRFRIADGSDDDGSAAGSPPIVLPAGLRIHFHEDLRDNRIASPSAHPA